MKLFRDFGVRALIAILACLGGFGVVLYILSHFEFEASTLVAIIAVLMTPFSTAMAFYFGQQKGRQDAKKESQQI